MPGRRVRFNPFIATSAGRYRGRLNVVAFRAEAVTEVATDFGTAEEAVEELIRRLRYMFQEGDAIEIRGTVHYDVAHAEVELRASLNLDPPRSSR